MTKDNVNEATAGTTVLPDGRIVPLSWRRIARPEMVAWVDSYNAEIASKREIAGEDKRRKALIDAYANGGNQQLKHEIAKARLLTVSAAIHARTIMAAAFFAPQTLQSDESGMIGIRSNWARKITARWVGVNGGGEVNYGLIESLKMIPIQLAFLDSDWVPYPVRDLMRGDLKLHDWINSELERRYAVRYDIEAKAVYDAALVPSGIGGLRARFELDPEIIASNVPDANYLDMTSEGAFTFPVMLAINKYARKFGLRVTNLFMSVDDVDQFYQIPSQVSLLTVTGYKDVAPQMTIPAEMRSAIFNKQGELQNLLGDTVQTNWLNTLPSGSVYVSFDQPCGWFVEKPDFNEVKIDDSAEMWDKGLERIKTRKAVNFIVPDPMSKNILKIDFA